MGPLHVRLPVQQIPKLLSMVTAEGMQTHTDLHLKFVITQRLHGSWNARRHGQRRLWWAGLEGDSCFLEIRDDKVQITGDAGQGLYVPQQFTKREQWLPDLGLLGWTTTYHKYSNVPHSIACQFVCFLSKSKYSLSTRLLHSREHVWVCAW